jgi:predicted dehydrogenase
MRVGIVGLGFMGATHVNSFSKLAGVQLAAICTRDARAASGDLRHIRGNLNRDAGVHDFSAVRNFEDWRDLMSDPTLDAVDICLPTDLHAPASIAALRAAKHVLCEKPMALGFAECEQMIAAAKEQNRVLMIGHVLRFWPEYLYLEKFVQERPYGAIKSAKFSRSTGLPDWSRWLPDEARSGGPILDLLIHDIDQILLLFGPPDVTKKHPSNPGWLNATLVYPDGLEVTLEGGWFAAGTPFSSSFEVQAEQTTLALTPEGLKLSENGQAELVKPEGGDAYGTEIAYFVDCCRKNASPERCLPQDSAKAVQLALLLKQQ